MEKLQAALERARQQRKLIQGLPADDDTAQQDATRRRVPPSHGTALDARWAGLTPFEVGDKQLDRYHLVSSRASQAASHFDVLRTKILLQMQQNNWKRLAITSPMPNCGKTTIACNLAMGLGRQSELRTLLMDMDLRSPSVAEFMRAAPEHDIGSLLTGTVPFAEQGMRLGMNIACAMTLKAESDPAQVLLSNKAMEVIDEIETTYRPDITIFDLPSMLVNDDSRAFLKNADCALIVARASTTRYRHFDACEREVAEHTNVMGVVLNAYSNEGVD